MGIIIIIFFFNFVDESVINYNCIKTTEDTK